MSHSQKAPVNIYVSACKANIIDVCVFSFVFFYLYYISSQKACVCVCVFFSLSFFNFCFVCKRKKCFNKKITVINNNA